MTEAATARLTPEIEVAPKRIAAIDGLRGLSIVLVLLYHCYSRWADVLPWAARYRYFVVFEHGGLGVNLFFIISGFVILMTLHNCDTFRGFLYRRWLRLFPAMCIATALIYLSADWLWERPIGPLNLRDTIPGLVFLDPWLLNRALSLDLKVIEGAFWSIFVEVKFYLLFGALYFARKERALLYLGVLFLGTWIYIQLPASLGAVHESVVLTLTKVLSLHHMGWFLIGALLYQAHSLGCKKSGVISALLLPFAIVADSGRSVEIVAVCAVLYGVFVVALYNTPTARLFSSRLFLFWGFISYPLYLIHQNMLVALTVKTHAYLPAVPSLLTPIPGIVGIVGVSYLIANYGEPMFRKWLGRAVAGRSKAPPK